MSPFLKMSLSFFMILHYISMLLLQRAVFAHDSSPSSQENETLDGPQGELLRGAVDSEGCSPQCSAFAGDRDSYDGSSGADVNIRTDSKFTNDRGVQAVGYQ